MIVPPAVAAELARATRTFAAMDLSIHPYIRVQPPQTPATSLPATGALHAGEREAIALALELKADVLLIDEQAGRAVAAQLGLRTIGVLGVLVEGKNIGRVVAVAPLIDRLVDEIGFFVAAPLRAAVLRLAGE